MTTKIVLKIEIEYELNGESPAFLEGLLENHAAYMADEGLMSGDTDAEVVDWTAEAYEVEEAGAVCCECGKPAAFCYQVNTFCENHFRSMFYGYYTATHISWSDVEGFVPDYEAEAPYKIKGA